MKNTTIAIDLAKSVFEIGISHRPGHVDQNHRLSRTELTPFMAAQPPATIVMEACSSAHFWGRTFEGFGHEVKLLPPFAVRPYVQRSKTDRTDVKGMLEASRNTDIRPVPVKTESQQQQTSLHRLRQSWMVARTMRLLLSPISWPASSGPFANSENHSSLGLKQPPEVRQQNTFPAAARLRFELRDEPVRPARGKADNTDGQFRPVQRLAPRARISSSSGASRSTTGGRRYDCSLISLNSAHVVAVGKSGSGTF